MEPLHALEAALHHELRDVLNERLRNTNFLVWIDIRPTGDEKHLVDADQIVRETEDWLASLDPDAVSGTDLPERVLRDLAAVVRLRAIPKKASARAYRSDQIVGNPEPILVGWG
jgi:hypothetical protein